jgi:hypothetical protein
MICTLVEGKEKLLAPKLNSLQKSTQAIAKQKFPFLGWMLAHIT